MSGATTARAAALASVFLVLLAARAPAQRVPPPGPSGPSPLRVGLALSGGSAKGFAHIGVLAVLDSAGLPVDGIAGTSMGAVIGGLRAAGYSAAQIRRVATTQDWGLLFSDVAARRDLTAERKGTEQRYLLRLPLRGGGLPLPSGLIAGQRISQLLERLLWPVQEVRDFRRLPVPFAAMATDLGTGEPVPLEGGSLSEAIRASLSIPSIFAPVEIHGRRLMDGSFSANLPALEVRRLGADVVVCSDVSGPLAPADSLRSFLDVIVQTLSFQIEASTERERAACDVLVEPDVSGLSAFDFGSAEAWIERGERAARKALPRLAALGLLPVEGERRGRLPPARGVDSIFAGRMRLEGRTRATLRGVQAVMGIHPPAWLTARRVDAAISRLYATGRFERITYRLDGGRGGGPPILVVVLSDESPGELGFGFRYESRYKASLLLSAVLRDLLRVGSRTTLDVRLGEQLQFGAGYLQRVGWRPSLLAGGDVRFTRAPLDRYEGGRRTSESRVELLEAGAMLGSGFGTTGSVGLRVDVERAHVSATVPGPGPETGTRSFYTLGGVLTVDSQDRAVFPTRGLRLHGRTEWASRALGSGADFSQSAVDLHGLVPVSSRVSLSAGATAGLTTGPDLPGYREFLLGGAIPYFAFPDREFELYGFQPQELHGRQLQAVRLGLQVEPRPNLLLGAAWNAGQVRRTWVLRPGEWKQGWGLTLGARTVFGPARVVLSGRDLAGWPDVTVDFGTRF